MNHHEARMDKFRSEYAKYKYYGIARDMAKLTGMQYTLILGIVYGRGARRETMDKLEAGLEKIKKSM